jgi:hypothetical protein
MKTAVKSALEIAQDVFDKGENGVREDCAYGDIIFGRHRQCQAELRWHIEVHQRGCDKGKDQPHVDQW